MNEEDLRLVNKSLKKLLLKFWTQKYGMPFLSLSTDRKLGS